MTGGATEAIAAATAATAGIIAIGTTNASRRSAAAAGYSDAAAVRVRAELF
jgi:hypothetical protein